MQHYGAPTRLLDFTNSFYIACYFALIDTNTDSCIWAINRHSLRDKLRVMYNLPYKHGVQLMDEVNRIHTDLANNYISVNKKDFSSVIPLESEIVTERLLKQQGLFLMPTNEKLSFMDNLLAIFNIPTYKDAEKTIGIDQLNGILSTNEKPDLIKIEITKFSRFGILEQLERMNITSEILFPGIDGLAKSLIQPYFKAILT